MTSLLRSFGSQGSELEVQTCQRLHLDLAGGDRSETGSCHQLSQQKSGDESPQLGLSPDEVYLQLRVGRRQADAAWVDAKDLKSEGLVIA